MNPADVKPDVLVADDQADVCGALRLLLKGEGYQCHLVHSPQAALEQLQNHAWPGNVRELEHVVERAVLMARGNFIQAGDLGLRASTEPARPLDDMSLEEVEAHLIRKTLARCDGNAQKAADALGLSRSASYRRLEKYPTGCVAELRLPLA